MGTDLAFPDFGGGQSTLGVGGGDAEVPAREVDIAPSGSDKRAATEARERSGQKARGVLVGIGYPYECHDLLGREHRDLRALTLHGFLDVADGVAGDFQMRFARPMTPWRTVRIFSRVRMFIRPLAAKPADHPRQLTPGGFPEDIGKPRLGGSLGEEPGRGPAALPPRRPDLALHLTAVRKPVLRVPDRAARPLATEDVPADRHGARHTSSNPIA